MTGTSYAEFLAGKAQLDGDHGFEPAWLPDWLFGFQAELVEWATRKGRAALFADCGLGKSPMQLVWAENVYRRTGKPVLVVAPLAVSFQTEGEATKFGIEAAVSRDGSAPAPITVTNYERLHLFDADRFGGVVCDESSAIKAFDGARRALVTEFLRRHRYRLLCTATAAPNDYIELGTSSEALGYLGHMDMLSRYFTNNAKARMWGRDGAWRFKGHAEEPFWRWVASWARALRRPSDLGHPDDGFQLPQLIEQQHVVDAEPAPADDALFAVPVVGLREERAEQRRTVVERCETAAELASQHKISMIWCQLNDEGDLLESLVPQSIQAKGSDSSDYKEAVARWFVGDLCICEHPLFRTKLAAWRGSRSMQPLDVLVTKLIRRSEHDARRKVEPQRPTATTCAGTTPSSPSGSDVRQSSRPSTTGDGASATHPTPSSASESEDKPASIQRSDETAGSAGSSESAPSSSMPFSRHRAEAAQFARRPSATAAADSSTLTTATRPAPSVASSAQNATSDSASSETIPLGWNEPPCICGHSSGERRLISKPSIFGWGLNFQHCAHIVYFPSYSYEQYYQAVRRCWRYGQQHPVQVDMVTTEGGATALASLQRKAEQADRMFDALVAHMRDAVSVRRSITFDREIEVPVWL